MPAEDITDATSRQSNTAGKYGGGKREVSFSSGGKSSKAFQTGYACPEVRRRKAQDRVTLSLWNGEVSTWVCIRHDGHIAPLVWASAS